jgi:recombination protein RecT
MNAESTNIVPATEPPKHAMKITDELAVLRPEVEKVLPAHVTPDKFMRVVLTAIAQTPALAKADRRSLLTSAVKAAQDGLLPDGREAAFVTFWDKKANTNKVQYMPMIAGVLKKVRNSGELLAVTCNVVHHADTFRYWIDDVGEHITHEPAVLAPDRGPLVAVYAVAKTKDGGTYTEVMSRQQIDQVRSVSRAKDSGPWVDWYGEMARKTVIRRLAKRLPMSTDLEAVIRRDDEMYDLATRPAQQASGGNAAVRAMLGVTVAEPPVEPIHDDEPISTEHGSTEEPEIEA